MLLIRWINGVERERDQSEKRELLCFFNFMTIFGVSAATIGAEPEAHYIEYFADEKERGRSCCIVL